MASNWDCWGRFYYFFLNGPTPASFCVFSFFSITILQKILDLSGIRKRIVGVEGEHADHMTTTTARRSFYCSFNIYLKMNFKFRWKLIICGKDSWVRLSDLPNRNSLIGGTTIIVIFKFRRAQNGEKIVCPHLPLILSKVFLKNGPTPASFWFIFSLFKQPIQFLQQINVKKCPSSIQCQDLNPQPLKHELSPITTRPGLPPYFVKDLTWCFLKEWPNTAFQCLFSSFSQCIQI